MNLACLLWGDVFLQKALKDILFMGLNSCVSCINRKGWNVVNMEKKSYEYTAIRVCVDAYGMFCMQGKIHSPFSEQEISFQDVTTFLVALEKLAEDRGFPEPMFKHRKFQSLQKKECEKEAANIVRTIEAIEKEHGEKETIRLFITGRRNAGIQGHFVCLSTGNLYQYSSELQLLQLMEQVLSIETFGRKETGTQNY